MTKHTLTIAVCAILTLLYSQPAHADPYFESVTSVVPAWCFRTESEAVFQRCAEPFVRKMVWAKMCCNLASFEVNTLIREVHLPLLMKVYRDHKSAAQKEGKPHD